MNGTCFVDKIEMLEVLISAVQQEQRSFYIILPRHFGKTVIANMIDSLFREYWGEDIIR